MPNTKKMGGKKKGNGRKRGRFTRVRHLPRTTVMPSSKHILQTYAFQYALTEAAASVGATYFFRLNSVYDPDSSGVGFTAGGYNTWSSLFLNYKVNKVTVRLQGTVSCSSDAFIQVICAPVASQSVVPTSPNYWMTIPGAKVYTVMANAVGGQNSFRHVASYDNAKVARVTKQQYANDMDFSGAVGSNPARQNYFLFAFRSVNSSTPGKAFYAVQLTYEVEWFNPVPMQN